MNGCMSCRDARKWTDQNEENQRSDWNRKMEVWNDDGDEMTALGSRNRGWVNHGSVESRTWRGKDRWMMVVAKWDARARELRLLIFITTTAGPYGLPRDTPVDSGEGV